ncbi:nucleotidyltransferase domain-containing protein [Aquirufa sp. ROCK-SH2]
MKKVLALSRELALLVQMVQQEILQVNSTFKVDGINWPKFKKACAYHGMRHVAFSANQQQAVLPTNLSHFYQKFAQQRAKSNLDNVLEIKRLYTLFENEGISPLLLKGALYTQLLYQNKLLRESTDIDFLFKKSDSLKGMKILIKENYQCRDLGTFHTSKNLDSDLQELINGSNFQELHFDKKSYNVDFHWELFNQFFYYQFDLSFLFDQTEQLNFYGQKIVVTRPEALFWSLIFHHGGKEFWLKFKDLVDLLAFMKTYQDQIDWQLMLQQAKDFNVLTVVKNGFWLIREVFAFELPEAIENELQHYAPKKIHLTVDFWGKANYWNKMIPRWNYEQILHHSQDQGYTFLSYLKKLYNTYNSPNPFERKRIFNFPSGWGILNFIDKILSYIFYHLVGKK